VWGHKTVKKWSFSAFFFLNYFFNLNTSCNFAVVISIAKHYN